MRAGKDANATPHQNGGLPAHIAAKILSVDGLESLRAQAKAKGRRLVQCHGCFDIVHPGHVRHLRQARALGDLLVVSITGDPGVGKGKGRPLIPEELRAENLAALDCVDAVCISPLPTAIELLERIRPDIYVKGKEYETNDDPRFKAERAAVERHGGRVVFTSGDVVFSSSALIAAMEQSVDPFQSRLGELMRREDLSGPVLYELLSRIRGKRIVIVGEPIIDTYVLCDRPEVASESPVLTLRPVEARHYDGGAAVVARHAAALGAKPVLVTPLPDGPDGESMRHRLAAEGVEVRSITVRNPVPEKQRFLVGQQKIVKVDLLEPYVLDAAAGEDFVGLAADAARDRGGCDACIITDFGLGLWSGAMLRTLCGAVRPHAGVMSGDVSGKRAGLRAMHGLDLLCPSETELRDAMQLQTEGLPLAVYRLLQETKARSAMVTMGPDGLVTFERLPGEAAADEPGWRTRLSSEHVPALCPVALDPLGCGDALLTSATLALSGGASLVQAAFLGACAAGTHVQRLGNVPISANDIRRMIARVHSAHLAFATPEAIEAAGAPRRAKVAG